MFFEKFKLDTVLRFLISRRVESSHSLEAWWNSVYRRVFGYRNRVFGYRNWEPSKDIISFMRNNVLSTVTQVHAKNDIQVESATLRRNFIGLTVYFILLLFPRFIALYNFRPPVF